MCGKRTKSKLGVERLENRELMAGNVGVSLDGGVLHIRGDAKANAIEVYEIGTDRYRVQGIDTKINGRAFQDFHVRKDAIKIDMGGGDDHVNLHDAVMKSFDISMGRGNDQLFVVDVNVTSRGNSAKVDTGSGDDFVEFSLAQTVGNLKVDLGSGDDQIEFNDSVVEKELWLWGGSGTNAVTVNNSEAGKIKKWQGF